MECTARDTMRQQVRTKQFQLQMTTQVWLNKSDILCSILNW